MRSVAFWRGRAGAWNTAIIISSIVVFLANLVAFMGQTPLNLPPLLSIPVVIAAYRYPKKGPLFGALVGAVYFVMVLSITRSIWGPVVEAMVLTGVLILIGWLVAFLSTRLREQERLYRGIFDNSEAGIFLIREEDSGRIVESANEKSSSLLGMRWACGHDTLSMHSVVTITGFDGHYGFRPIPEGELPASIRERFAWANGEMQGANVCPMRRDAENH